MNATVRAMHALPLASTADDKVTELKTLHRERQALACTIWVNSHKALDRLAHYHHRCLSNEAVTTPMLAILPEICGRVWGFTVFGKPCLNRRVAMANLGPCVAIHFALEHLKKTSTPEQIRLAGV